MSHRLNLATLQKITELEELSFEMTVGQRTQHCQW